MGQNRLYGWNYVCIFKTGLSIDGLSDGPHDGPRDGPGDGPVGELHDGPCNGPRDGPADGPPERIFK